MLSADLFSLYIHVPFCQLKCPYCDFNSYVLKAPPYQLWLERCLESLSYWHDYINKYGKLQKIDSIFFGGGTPSVVPHHMIEALLNKSEKLFGFAHDIEISIEANPTSAESQKFSAYKQMGINRISLGIQSLNNEDLKFLGRNHSAEEAINAWYNANKYFSNTSLDLIYARNNKPLTEHEAVDEWQEELKYTLNLLSPNHLSLYELTIEKGTEFYKNKLQEQSDDIGQALYMVTQHICNEFQIDNYEISNHAKKEHKCKHNLIYWRGGQWLGIGPSAHSRLNLYSNHLKKSRDTNYNNKIFSRFNIFQIYKLDTWLSSSAQTNYKISKLSPKRDFNERILGYLRLNEQCNLQKLAQLSSVNLDDAIDSDNIDWLIQDKFITYDKNKNIIQVQPKGKFVLNTIIRNITT